MSGAWSWSVVDIMVKVPVSFFYGILALVCLGFPPRNEAGTSDVNVWPVALPVSLFLGVVLGLFALLLLRYIKRPNRVAGGN
jgi:hypothetical protein